MKSSSGFKILGVLILCLALYISNIPRNKPLYVHSDSFMDIVHAYADYVRNESKEFKVFQGVEETYSGSVLGYTEAGALVFLDILMHDSKGFVVQNTFMLDYNSVFFDSDKGRAIRPQEIKKGTFVHLYTRQSGSEMPAVDALILGDDYKYLEVEAIKGNELYNKSREVYLVLQGEFQIKNALTGDNYSFDKLRVGDKVFYTLGVDGYEVVHSEDFSYTFDAGKLVKGNIYIKGYTGSTVYNLYKIVVYPYA